MVELKLQGKAIIPTKWGEFDIYAFSDTDQNYIPELVLVNPNTDFSKEVNIRIHSECITGDLFTSKRCECGEQLKFSFDYISKHTGILIYLRQEGRGIGIIEKLKAYNIQDQGFDTIEANKMLGHKPDERNYDIAISIINYFKIKKVNLLTNNPLKLDAFNNSGISITNRIPVIIIPNADNSSYLKVKKEQFGHLLD